MSISLPGIRSGRAPNPLADYADEVAALAESLRAARFRGSERYVIDADALQRALADLAQRMRRTASERRTAPAAATAEIDRVFRPKVKAAVTVDRFRGGSLGAVVVEHRRKRA